MYTCRHAALADSKISRLRGACSLPLHVEQTDRHAKPLGLQDALALLPGGGSHAYIEGSLKGCCACSSLPFSGSAARLCCGVHPIRCAAPVSGTPHLLAAVYAHIIMHPIVGTFLRYAEQVCRRLFFVHGSSTCSSPAAAPLPLRPPASSARSASSTSLFRLACASRVKPYHDAMFSAVCCTIDKASAIAQHLNKGGQQVLTMLSGC